MVSTDGSAVDQDVMLRMVKRHLLEKGGAEKRQSLFLMPKRRKEMRRMALDRSDL
jgi:hypothetical protein